MTHRTIKAYSKATHTISKVMMHGNTYTHDEGQQTVLHVITGDTDEQIVSRAKAECEKRGLELWKVFVIGAKATSFNTDATWCDGELYRDDTRALYFEGVFDCKGNRIDDMTTNQCDIDGFSLPSSAKELTSPNRGCLEVHVQRETTIVQRYFDGDINALADMYKQAISNPKVIMYSIV